MLEAAANPLVAAAHGLCFDGGGVVNGLMVTAFLVFILSLLILVVVLWGAHNERTGAGRFNGITLDEHQRAYLKSYFSAGRGRIHGLVMLACLALHFGPMAVAMVFYDAKWESCDALRARRLDAK